MAGSFGLFSVRLDLSRGDTCHHRKGDTWHGMTSAAYVSDDVSNIRGDDVATSGWLTVVESGVDTCPLVANSMRTGGPIRGRHVSLIVWLNGLCVKFVMARTGFEPVTSSTDQEL
jgi:hypothetical protein